MPGKIPKGGWLTDIADEYDVGGGPDLGPMAQAQTEDTDAALGEMAAGLESPPPEVPEMPAPRAAGVPRQAFERLAMMAPAMPQPAASAVDVDATNERDDIERGRDRDAQARLMRSIELGGKQLNAAFGKTPVAELSSPASTSYEKDATARADRGEAKRFSQTQATLANAHRQAMLERQQRQDALAAEQKRIAKERQDERDQKGDLEKDEDQGIRKEQNKAMLALANANLAATRSERDYKHDKDQRDDERSRIKGLPSGWELEDGLELTDKQKQDFGGLVVSSEKMKGLTKRLRELLSKASLADKVLPTALNNQLSQVATQLVIEGKNVAELGALSGPDMGLMNSIAADPSNVRNILKDAGALSSGLDAWADNSVAANAKLGFRRKAAGNTPGKILVSNGRETLSIDPGDEQAAAADGYKRVAK